MVNQELPSLLLSIQSGATAGPRSPLTTISFLFTFFRTLLHSPNTQLFSFHAIPHSFAKTPGGGYPPSIATSMLSGSGSEARNARGHSRKPVRALPCLSSNTSASSRRFDPPEDSWPLPFHGSRVTGHGSRSTNLLTSLPASHGFCCRVQYLSPGSASAVLLEPPGRSGKVASGQISVLCGIDRCAVIPAMDPDPVGANNLQS